MRRGKAIEIAVETFDALVVERGDSGKIWALDAARQSSAASPISASPTTASAPSATCFEEAQARGLPDFGRDEKSGTFVFLRHRRGDPTAATTEPCRTVRTAGSAEQPVSTDTPAAKAEGSASVAVAARHPREPRSSPRRHPPNSQAGASA